MSELPKLRIGSYLYDSCSRDSRGYPESYKVTAVRTWKRTPRIQVNLRRGFWTTEKISYGDRNKEPDYYEKRDLERWTADPYDAFCCRGSAAERVWSGGNGKTELRALLSELEHGTTSSCVQARINELTKDPKLAAYAQTMERRRLRKLQKVAEVVALDPGEGRGGIPEDYYAGPSLRGRSTNRRRRK